MDLTIIILNYNRREMLRDCLESIIDLKINYEICVVDNGSTDGSADMVAQDFPKVHLTRNSSNLGFSKANNQILNTCDSRYALLLNNDTIVLPGTIERMVMFMNAYPAVGLAGCKLLNSDGSLQPSTYGTQSVLKAFLRLTGLRDFVPKNAFWRKIVSKMPLTFQKHFTGYWDHETMREVKTVKGAFFLMRVDTIRDVGVLDETTFMYHEEGEWAYRLLEKGWKIYFVPVTGVIHYGGPSISSPSISTNEFQVRIDVEKHKGLLNIFKKHHSRIEFWLVKWIIIVVSLLKLLFWIGAKHFSDKKAVWQLRMHRQVISMAYQTHF